jgi:hypothetical protein
LQTSVFPYGSEKERNDPRKWWYYFFPYLILPPHIGFSEAVISKTKGLLYVARIEWISQIGGYMLKLGVSGQYGAWVLHEIEP